MLMKMVFLIVWKFNDYEGCCVFTGRLLSVNKGTAPGWDFLPSNTNALTIQPTRGIPPGRHTVMAIQSFSCAVKARSAHDPDIKTREKEKSREGG